MSKRASEHYMTQLDQTGPTKMNNDTPMRATAAQLANRKIKAVPRRRGSPSPGPPSNGPAVNFNPTPAASFNFGASAPQDNSQSTSFTFGQSGPSASFPPTNGVAQPDNNLSASKSFGGFGGGNAFGAANGSSNDASNAFGNSSFQSNTGGFSFGASQNTAPSNPFGSIASSANAGSSSPFTFGAAATTPVSSPAATPFSFGNSQPTAQENPSFGNTSSATPSFSFGQSNTTASTSTTAPSFGATASPTTTNGFSFGSNQAKADAPTTFTSKFAPSTTTTTSNFSFTKPAASTPATSSPFTFGTGATASSSDTTTSQSFSFGANPAVASPFKTTTAIKEVSSTPSFSFGSPAPSPAAASSPTSDAAPASKPFSFGSIGAISPAPKTSTNLFNFGASADLDSTGTDDSSSTNIFAAAKQTPQAPSQSAARPAPQPTPTFQFTSPKSSSATTASPSQASTASMPSASSSSNQLTTSKYAHQTLRTTAPISKPKMSNPEVGVSLRDWVLRETGVEVPPQITSADRPQFWRDVKMQKLNEQMFQCFAAQNSRDRASFFKNYSPLFEQYMKLAAEIEGSTPAGQSTGSGNASGGSIASNQTGSSLAEGAAAQNKPAIGPSTPSKFASTGSSDTAKKFNSFLSTSPSKLNNSTTPQSSPAKGGLFNTAGSTPFKVNSTTADAGAKSSNISSQTQSSTPAAGSGFKPSMPASSATKPSFGFQPTGTNGGSTNFLAQFGAKSKLSAEEEKKKRKAEDFDSDEDDEAEWEANYEKEQEAKRRKFEESRSSLAPPPKFDSNPGSAAGSVATSRSVSPAGSVLDGPRPTGVHMFSHVSDNGSPADDDDGSDEEQSPAKDKQVNGTKTSSLFNRVSPREDSDASNGANGDKPENPGDHTWKPSTPIKFSSPNGVFNFPPAAASAPPKTANSTGGLFSSIKPQATSTPGANSIGSFSFGKANPFPLSGTSSVLTTADTSRATTPLESEAGSNAGEAEAEEAPTSQPANDLVNWEASKDGHDVLFEFDKAKAYKYVNPNKEQPDQKHGWLVQGQGPVAILKNEGSGVVTILMKQSPSGKIVINTRILSEPLKYTKEGKRLKLQVPRSSGPGIEGWLIQVGSEAMAEEMAKICEQNRPSK